MKQMEATFDLRMPSKDVAVIDVRGDVTSTAEDSLMDAYTRATDEGAAAIILNFSSMDYMNSSGIGLLVTLLIRIHRHGQRLLTFGVSDHYKRIFELTRLDDAIGIFDTEDAAIASGESGR
jgi:anti-sigma B factor antagonist